MVQSWSYRSDSKGNTGDSTCHYHPKTAFYVFTQQIYILNVVRHAAQSTYVPQQMPCLFWFIKLYLNIQMSSSAAKVVILYMNLEKVPFGSLITPHFSSLFA
jgi:hypothetical protein